MVLLVGAFFALNSYIYEQKQAPSDYKAATYIIEGQPTVIDGTTTRYFGNELKTDLNGDGREDVAFLVTHSPGGSGTFYYVVGAVQDADGRYQGTDGYFLGDRIAPQTTNVSQDPRHVRVIVVNYADRAAGEPMTARPSIGKSAYLKLNPDTMQWGVVLSPEESQSL